MWNFYSPISGVVERIYGWDDYLVEWIANTAGLVYTIVVCFASMLVDARGARVVVVLAGFGVLACGALRLVPVALADHEYLVFVSMVFNGLAAAPIGLCPPGVSAAWFPANERTLATAIATTSNYLGQAVGFFLGPAMVPDNHRTNRTNRTNSTNRAGRPDISSGGGMGGGMGIGGGGAGSAMATSIHGVMASGGALGALGHHPVRNNHTTDTDYLNLQRLYWVEAGMGAAVFLILLIYWPEKPPVPPTTSAAQPRTNFMDGFRELVTHRRFWTVCLSFGVPTGVFGGWIVVLDLNLQSLQIEEIDQNVASLIGTLQIVAGCVVGILVSALNDRCFKRQLKRAILAMYAVAFLCFTAFAVLCQMWKSGALPFNMAALYVVTILGGMMINGTIPLFYELGMETVFPIPESGAAGLMMLVQNALQSAFLAVPTPHGSSAMWMNWTLAACIPVFMLWMATFTERYPRADMDALHVSKADK